MIRVAYVQPAQKPVMTDMPNTLRAAQQMVDGYIQILQIPFKIGTKYDYLYLVCNEDGIRLGLPQNRAVGGHRIFGNFLICRIDRDGDHASLTSEDFEAVATELAVPRW